jgi:hypothetical protein
MGATVFDTLVKLLVGALVAGAVLYLLGAR